MITLEKLLKIEPQHFQAKARAEAIVHSLKLGSTSALPVLELAKKAGISEATLRRAREKAGVRAVNIAGEWIYNKRILYSRT